MKNTPKITPWGVKKKHLDPSSLPGTGHLQRTCAGALHFQESLMVPSDMGDPSDCIYNRTVTTPETCINECFSCGYCQYAVWLPTEQICSLFKDKKECEKTEKVTTAYSKSQPGQPLLLNCIYCLADEGNTVRYLKAKA